jgi:hypothetical protein
MFRVAGKGARSIRCVNAAGEHRRKTIDPLPAIGLAAARVKAYQIKGEAAGKVSGRRQ